MTQVTIKERLMGQGKSKEMIEQINKDIDTDTSKYIIVLPYLSECHRYAGTISEGKSQQPKKQNRKVVYTGEGCNASGRKFYHPTNFNGGKLSSLERLIQQGNDIVTTHATLKNFSKETLSFIQDTPYTLVIDEELECIKQYKGFTKTRRDMLFGKYIEVNPDTNALVWIGGDIDTPKDDWVTEIKNLCESGSLFKVEDTVFMWEYPVEFLKAFKKIIVLSYMVYGSMFWAYLKHHNIDFTIERTPRPEKGWKSLIRILDNDKLNTVGDDYYALSSGYFKRRLKYDSRGKPIGVNTELDYGLTQIKKNTYNFFYNYCKTPSKDNMWGTLGEARKQVSGAGYSRGHVSINCKATNEYRHKKSLAYLYNVFMSPKEEQYVSKWEHKPREDIIALSVLLQWVFRSQVREGKPIDIYIPSSRMRSLLEAWIEDEFFYLKQ